MGEMEKGGKGYFFVGMRCIELNNEEMYGE